MVELEELPASACWWSKASPLQDCRIQLSSPTSHTQDAKQRHGSRPRSLHEIFFFFFEDSAWLDLSYPTKNRNTVKIPEKLDFMGTGGGSERRRGRETSKLKNCLKETRVTGHARVKAPSGRRSGHFVSLCRPTQAPPWAPWSSFLSGRKAPLLRPSSPPSSSGVRASSFQSLARFRCPGVVGCPPSPSLSGPPRPAGTSTSVV